MGALYANEPVPKKRTGYYTQRRVKDYLTGYLFILPALVGLVVFTLIPAASAFVLSAFQWDIVTEPEFIGLKNFTLMFNDPLFWNGILVTFQYMLYHIIPSLVLAFFMAVAIKQKLWGSSVFRSVFVMPWITTPVIVSIIWKWLLDPTFGPTAYLLSSIGLKLEVIVNTFWFPMVSVALVNMWIYCGYHMMVFTAGLGNIPNSLYEASVIDGANNMAKIWYITLPLLKPTIMFSLITSVIGSFQVFDTIFGMYQGGPGDATRVYYYLLYNNAFQYFKMGYASAMAVVLFIVLLILTVVQYLFFQRDNTTDYSS